MADRKPTLRPRVDGDHPPCLYPDYRATLTRARAHAPVLLVESPSERTGPGPVCMSWGRADLDLTTNAGTGSAAIGERIIVTGRVLDEYGVPLSNTVIEIWQANASGRYRHHRETEFPAPLDPNFLGVGRCATDAEGRYRFTTVRPGAYPWGNHHNAWRPAHIHFSLLGPTLGTRLVTQMYFPGDPLQARDPIFRAVPEGARARLVARYDHEVTRPHWALGYRWDIVLRGREGEQP